MLVARLEEQMKHKAKELNDFQVKYGIRVKGEVLSHNDTHTHCIWINISFLLAVLCSFLTLFVMSTNTEQAGPQAAGIAKAATGILV